MKLSLSTFVYFRYALFEAIRRTAAHGYQAVEIWGGRPHAYCLFLWIIRMIFRDRSQLFVGELPAQQFFFLS